MGEEEEFPYCHCHHHLTGLAPLPCSPAPSTALQPQFLDPCTHRNLGGVSTSQAAVLFGVPDIPPWPYASSTILGCVTLNASAGTEVPRPWFQAYRHSAILQSGLASTCDGIDTAYGESLCPQGGTVPFLVKNWGMGRPRD